MGICLSNMAAIRFGIQEYEIAHICFDQAAKFLEEEIDQNDPNKSGLLLKNDEESPMKLQNTR